MNVELFWTGIALMSARAVAIYIKAEIAEFFTLRQFNKWVEEFEVAEAKAKPVKKVAKKK